MQLHELIRWQWDSYSSYHRSRKNLMIHIVAVPLFWIGNLNLIVSLTAASLIGVLVSIGLMLLSLILQGRGHAIEALPPVPFTSKFNAIARLLIEQWINFPRFVFSGAWLRAFKAIDAE